MEHVTLHTEDSKKITANYFPPNLNNPNCIILIHMMKRNKEDWNEFANTLCEKGYAVIALDLRGHGQSEGILETSNDYQNMLLDIESALDFLKTKQTNYKMLSLIGASIGANLALNFAASETDVNTVILLSPGLDYHGIETEKSILDYGSRPILIAASDEDTYSYDSSKILSRKALGKSEFLKLKNCGHGTDMFSDFSLQKRILEWLEMFNPSSKL